MFFVLNSGVGWVGWKVGETDLLKLLMCKTDIMIVNSVVEMEI